MPIQSKELEPNKKNILSSLAEDILERNDSVWHFARFCDAINGRCSIAINAKWGEGKTFFVKQAKMLLEAFNPFSNTLDESEKTMVHNAFLRYIRSGEEQVSLKPHVCVYYDSWINDNDVDPIFSLIFEITKSTSCDYPFKKRRDCLKALAEITDFFTGKNAANLVELVHGEDYLEKIKYQREIHIVIEEFLESLLAENGDRLIIFIDELDRCKPTYAIQLLERIKHYFSNDRITFVFSVNIDELQHTIRSCYGEGFNACRYLDRFFDYRIPLPQANMTKYYQKLGLQYQEYIIDIVRKAVIDEFEFGIREIEKYYRITQIAISDTIFRQNYFSYANGFELKFSYNAIVPIAIGLQMRDIDLYNDFINGKNSQPLVDILGSGDVATRICSLLLDNNETFNENISDGSTYVKLSDKLNEAYNALFNNKKRFSSDGIRVGSCCFSQDTKAKTLKMISMLSGYAKYDY